MTDLVARTAAIAAKARSAQPTREQNRERYPDFARWMDEMRKMPGEYYRVTDLVTGHVRRWGNPVPDAVVANKMPMVTCADLAALQAKHPRRW